MSTLYTWFLSLSSLVTWQRSQMAFVDFLLPPNRTMWDWSCPSLNANTAWVACYWDSRLLFLSNTAVYLASPPCSALCNTSKVAAQNRSVQKCHQVPHGADCYTADPAWLLSLHRRSQQQRCTVCPQKWAPTDSGSSDVLQAGLKQVWSRIKMWNHWCSLCSGYQLKHGVIFTWMAQELKLAHDKPLRGSEAFILI